MSGQGVSAGYIHPRRGTIVTLALTASVLALMLVAPRVAHAGTRALTPSAPVTRGSGYVALGDSVTFGYQEPGVSPTPDYHRPASFRGYPEQLGTELHLRVANFACPGETAASLVNDKAPTLACENAYRLAYPLHVRYRGSQLRAAVRYLRTHPGVRLVSLMIGANDLFRCQEVTADGCASRAELDATHAEITRNVRRTLSAVRTEARYRGQIVMVDYYSLDYGSAATNAYTQGLNRAQAAGTRGFRVRFANGFGEWRTATRRFAANSCLAGLLTQLGSYGKCGIHPSYAGQALLAKAVATATRL